MLELELPERLLARRQRAPCGAEVERGGVQEAHDLVQGWVRRQARGAVLTVTVTGNSRFPVEMDPIGGVHRRSDIALQHDAFKPIPGVRMPFYRDGLRGLALDVGFGRQQRSLELGSRGSFQWHVDRCGRARVSGRGARANQGM